MATIERLSFPSLPVERSHRALTAPPSRRTRALRVLMISHTCQSRSAGQPKAERLGLDPGIDLRVLIPDRWREYGAWRHADTPASGRFSWEVARVAWPWMGPAQSYLHWYPTLLGTLRSFRPDIIDIWEEPWGLASAQVCWLRNRVLPRTRIVAETEQNIDKSLPLLFERFRSYTLRNADFVIGRSREALTVLRNKGYRGPAAVVPNAVDATLFRPLDREQCRRTMGLTGFVVGYVGRLVEEKGLMDMVDALDCCPDDVQLLFVGTGRFQEPLERRARELGMRDRLHFSPFCPAEQLPQVMNALDALVLVSRTTPRWKEQFGRVIIEAHACGTPVIGSDSGAIPEVVGQGGIVVTEGDPRALAAAICGLRDDPARKAALGAVGRRQVEADYTWERVAERMGEIYGRLDEAPVPAAESSSRRRERFGGSRLGLPESLGRRARR